MTTDVLRTADVSREAALEHGPRLATWTAGSALLLGALGDFLLRGGPPGLGFGIWIAAVVLALELLSRLRDVPWTLTQRLLVVPVLFFGESLAWRDAEFLRVLNVAAMLLASAVLSAALYRWPEWDAARAKLRDYVLACMGAGFSALGGAIPLLDGVVAERPRGPVSERTRRARAVGRGLLIAVPLVAVFGGLLMSADPVFSRLVTRVLAFDPATVFWHGVTTLALAWPIAGVLRGTLIGRGQLALAERPLRFRLGLIETASALGALDALFLSFVLVQARYLFGGASHVMATAGLTYAEYARRGFFELVWVVLLALPVILLSYELLRREEPRAERVWRWLVGAMLALLALIMVSALQRMRLYTAAYGLTDDRLYATAFMLWLGVSFVWLAFTVLRGRPHRFGIGALASGWAMLALLDLASPDALIARANLARYRETGKVDGAYLGTLGAEAVPHLVRALPALPADQGCRVATALANRWAPRPDHDWRSWSRSRAEARALVARHRADLERRRCAPVTPVPAAPDPVTSSPAGATSH